jgi:DnaA regulatory inactivator Hda
MTTDQQLPLDLVLPRRRARGRADFLVSGSNADALRMIERWRSWPGNRLALIGPAGAGKTHLAHVWMAEAGAETVSAAALRPDDVPALIAAKAICVEDADRIAGQEQAEAALFHLMNLAAAEGAHLLITGRGAPRDWKVVTPDLASRLRALTAVSIEPPDEALLRDLIAKLFLDRGLRVNSDVARFLAFRIERSAAAASRAVDQLDQAALEQRRGLTLPFVKDTLGY